MLASLLPGLIIAIISSWTTVKLSLKKFQKEKLWELKLGAYTKVIESLHNLKEYIIREESFIIGERERESFPEADLKRLAANYKLSYEEVFKFKDIGTLIMCEEAISILNKCCDELTKAETSLHSNNPCAYTDAVFIAVQACLNALVKIARSDLKL